MRSGVFFPSLFLLPEPEQRECGVSAGGKREGETLRRTVPITRGGQRGLPSFERSRYVRESISGGRGGGEQRGTLLGSRSPLFSSRRRPSPRSLPRGSRRARFCMYSRRLAAGWRVGRAGERKGERLSLDPLIAFPEPRLICRERRAGTVSFSPVGNLLALSPFCTARHTRARVLSPRVY